VTLFQSVLQVPGASRSHTLSAATYALAVWGGDGQGQMVRCPRCQKRVKFSADTCHHCGYSAASSPNNRIG
jgi:ribosomal protein L37E